MANDKNIIGDFDISKYIYNIVLKKAMQAKYNIKSKFLELTELKVIIFFENMIIKLDDKEENIDKNKKIDESIKVYSFFRYLVKNEKCNINNFNEEIRILGTGCKLTQESSDDDIQYFIKEKILKEYMIPFIEEYKNYFNYF
jgi:hypothetical protein